MAKLADENKLDHHKLLTKICAINTSLERLQEAIENLFLRDFELSENQLDCQSVFFTFIPSINKHLSEAGKFLPEKILSKNDIHAIKSNPRVLVQYQQSLEMILCIMSRILPNMSNKEDLLIIYEILNRLYLIGTALIQVYPRDSQLAGLVGAVKDNSCLINMGMMSPHE